MGRGKKARLGLGTHQSGLRDVGWGQEWDWVGHRGNKRYRLIRGGWHMNNGEANSIPLHIPKRSCIASSLGHMLHQWSRKRNTYISKAHQSSSSNIISFSTKLNWTNWWIVPVLSHQVPNRYGSSINYITGNNHIIIATICDLVLLWSIVEDIQTYQVAPVDTS